MKKSVNINHDKRNMIWNMLGAMSYGFTSLIYMIIITRVNGTNDSGLFTFAFAMACVFYTIGSYSGKTYQITETDKEINDFDYIYCRLISVILMVSISLVFSFIMHYDKTKFLLIFILTLYRGIDVITDTFHAIIQRNNELYKVGISLFIKTIILTIVFLLVNIVTKNILISTLSILIIEIFFCILVDYRISKKFLRFTKFEYLKFKRLIKNGFFVFCYTFLTSYVINVPRYILDLFYNNEMQAIYGIIVMPATFMAMVAAYLVQPYLNKIVNYIEEKKYKEIVTMTKKLSFLVLGLGLIALCLAGLLGIPVLQMLYNITLSKQQINLMIIILGSVLFALIHIFSAIIISLRRTFEQLIILIITAVLSMLMGYILVKNNGIFGASLTYLIIMCIQTLLYVFITIHFLKKDVKENFVKEI